MDIPQTLTQAFVSSPYIKPLERLEFNTLVEELKLSMSGMTDEEAALQVGRVLGAEYILLGSFIKIGSQVKINCRIIHTETGEITIATSVRGKYESLFDIQDELADKIEESILKEI